MILFGQFYALGREELLHSTKLKFLPLFSMKPEFPGYKSCHWTHCKYYSALLDLAFQFVFCLFNLQFRSEQGSLELYLAY